MGYEDLHATVAIIGAGAVGLSIAGAMATSGHSIAICGSRQTFDNVRVTKQGETESWPVVHWSSPACAHSARTVIVAVKAQNTRDIGDWLLRFDSRETTVLVAQNGIEHRDRVAPFLTLAQVVPAVVYINAERTSPGAVTVRHVGQADIAVGTDSAATTFANELMAGGMRVAIEPDLKTVMWSKLLANIAANPLTALTGRRTEVIFDEDVRDLARTIMTEAAAVGRADGAALTDHHIDDALAWLQNLPERSTTSMREDRLAGRELEHEAITGAILRASERHGLPAPTNRLLYTLLNAIRPGAS